MAALGERVLFSHGMARPMRRALAVAADPDLLSALGARLGPDPTRSAVWLRSTPVGDGVAILATRAFLQDDQLATASVVAAIDDIRDSVALQTLVLALEGAAEDPEAWIGGDAPAAAPSRAAAAELDSQASRLLARLRPSDPRPATIAGTTSWTFWESVGAFYERIAEDWRPAVSAAYGFAEAPSACLIAGRSDGAPQEAADTTGDSAPLATLGPAPADLAADVGAAADTLRRRLAQAETAATWPREKLSAFLTDFDAPSPAAPARLRPHVEFLSAIAGTLEERAVDRAPAAPFGLARAVGLAAFDVGAMAREAWSTFVSAQPSLAGWSALLVARLPKTADGRALDAIDGLEGFAELVDLDQMLRAAMAEGASTPLDSPAFAARVAALAEDGPAALARAPRALVALDRDGRWRPARWTEAHADLFVDLPRPIQHRIADRLADIEQAAALGAGDPAPRAAWRSAIESLRRGSALDVQAPAPIQFARNFLDALGEAVAGAAPNGALFWRRAFDAWIEQQQIKQQFELEPLLSRIAEKLTDRPGAGAARRTIQLALARVARRTVEDRPEEDGAPAEDRDDENGGDADRSTPEPRAGAAVAALFGERPESDAEPEPDPDPETPREPSTNTASVAFPTLRLRRAEPKAAEEPAADSARAAEEFLEEDFDEGFGEGFEEDFREEGDADFRPRPAAPLEAPGRRAPEPEEAEQAGPTPRAFERQEPAAADEAPEPHAPVAASPEPEAEQPEAPNPETEPDPEPEPEPESERPRRLGSGLARVRADIEQGLGVEKASDREIVRQRDPGLLNVEDAIASASKWRRSFMEELERRLSGEGSRPWSLITAAGSAQEAVRQVRHFTEVVDELGKRAETRLPHDVVWAARQFSELGLDAKTRARPSPAPRSLRQAWAAVADAPLAEEPEIADLYLLALASEWLTLEPVDSRARPLVRLFEVALGGAAAQVIQLPGGRVAEVGPRTLADYIYEPQGRDGFDTMERTALLARLDRLLFFLSLLDWRVSLDPREKRARLSQLWRPALVADIVAPHESDRVRQERLEDALGALDAPERFVDRLGEELRAGGEEARSYASNYCAMVERTRFPKVGQLGRLYQLLRRDVLVGR